MRNSWISLLGILGIVTTSCLGFTVERSNIGTLNSRNWSSPIFHSDRSASLEKIFNGGIRSADIESILRDSETSKLVKRPEEKYSSSSEESQSAKRSNDIFDTTNHLTIAEKIPSETKETTVVSSSSEIKTLGSSVASSAKEKKPLELRYVSSAKGMKPSGSTIVSSAKEMKTSESAVVSSAKDLKTSEPTIVPSAKEMQTSEITSKKSVESENLKNVVLLLVDNAGTSREHFWKNFEAAHKFSVQGFLQNCRDAEVPDSVKFSLGDSLVSGKRDEDCECDRFLRSNIASLLSWARHTKEMTTGAVSAINFSIPMSLGYESPRSQLAKEFEDNDEVNLLHQEVPRLKSEPRDIWHLVDLEKRSMGEKQSLPSTSAPSSMGSISKQEGNNGFDGMWDVFDMFSRIRIAFFRILLESLGNISGSDEEFNGKKPFSVQSSLVELVTDAIRELKSGPNDKGFVLVAASSGNELSAVFDILQREISTTDTLLVISGICSPTNEPVPFFALGPGGKSLDEARTIWDLPESIRAAITDGCFNKSCKTQRTEKPVVLPSIELFSQPDQEVSRKRVGRATAEEEVSSESTVDDKSTQEPDNETDESTKTKAPTIGGKRSGASDIRTDNVGKILGIATSIAAMLALNSP